VGHLYTAAEMLCAIVCCARSDSPFRLHAKFRNWKAASIMWN